MAIPSKHIDLFMAFFRVGMLGYGGGPSSIPLVHAEAVDKYQWMETDEFADILAIGNTLPGPIATKMAGYIGYRVAGVMGTINAVLATALPTILLMIFLLTSLMAMKDESWVQGMSAAVIPVVGVLLAQLTWGFLDKSQACMGWTVALLVFTGSYVVLELFAIHPAFLIGAVFLYVLVYPHHQRGGNS